MLEWSRYSFKALAIAVVILLVLSAAASMLQLIFVQAACPEGSSLTCVVEYGERNFWLLMPVIFVSTLLVLGVAVSVIKQIADEKAEATILLFAFVGLVLSALDSLSGALIYILQMGIVLLYVLSPERVKELSIEVVGKFKSAKSD